MRGHDDNARAQAWRLAVGGLVLAALVAGCADAPAESFLAATRALERGDQEAFLARLTERSRPMAAGVVSATDAERRGLFQPTQAGTVVVDDVAEEGDRAVLRASAGETSLTFVLALEDGEWRIDLLESERAWARTRLRERMDAALPLE